MARKKKVETIPPIEWVKPIIKEVATTSEVIKMDTRVGKVISGLKNPIELSYDGQGVMLPPKGKLENIEFVKLGILPKGVTFVTYSK